MTNLTGHSYSDWIANPPRRMAWVDLASAEPLQLVWTSTSFGPMTLANAVLLMSSHAGCFFSAMKNLWDNRRTVVDTSPTSRRALPPVHGVRGVDQNRFRNVYLPAWSLPNTQTVQNSRRKRRRPSLLAQCAHYARIWLPSNCTGGRKASQMLFTRCDTHRRPKAVPPLPDRLRYVLPTPRQSIADRRTSN